MRLSFANRCLVNLKLVVGGDRGLFLNTSRSSSRSLRLAQPNKILILMNEADMMKAGRELDIRISENPYDYARGYYFFTCTPL